MEGIHTRRIVTGVTYVEREIKETIMEKIGNTMGKPYFPFYV